jgi:Holliday junction resolvase
VVERSVQGIDLEVTLGGRRLALEVKTTEGDSIKLGKKDVRGLVAHQADGFEVFIAVLGAGLLDEWVVARFHEGEIPADGEVKTVLLRTYRDGDIESAISDRFDEALARHLAVAVEEGGQGRLDEVLRGYEAYAMA